MSTPIHLTGAEFLTPLTKGLAEPSTSQALGKTMERSAKQSRDATEAVPFFEDWREAAHQIKQYAIANLDKLLVEFERNVTARGATVLWAKDAAEANQHVLDIAKEHNVKSVVKSKSMVSEEMELDHVLEAAGIRAVETDFGEYIVQVAGQRPVHIVGARPAHVGRRRGPSVRGETRRAVHRRPHETVRHRPAAICARSIFRPTWACRAATSPWPTPARSS